MRLPRLGFLGVGWIGRKRIESIVLAGAAEAAAIADPDDALLDEAAQAAPGARRFHSLEEMLELDLDGVVIATPSALHAGQTIAALDRGLSVFCQKPLGRNAREVGAIIDAARRADRLLGIDLSYRHVVGMQKIRALIQEGELGGIFAGEVVFHNAYGPQRPWFYEKRLSGGGCVIDLGIHLVDAALWALDANVAAVSGCVFAGGRRLGPDDEQVEDYATARLETERGAVLNLSCSWRLHAGRDAVIEAAFYGTQGGVALRNINGSFTEFLTTQFSGTTSRIIAEPPDAWGGRAAVAWSRQLGKSAAYDPEIERQVVVAKVLDCIYGRGSCNGASAGATRPGLFADSKSA